MWNSVGARSAARAALSPLASAEVPRGDRHHSRFGAPKASSTTRAGLCLFCAVIRCAYFLASFIRMDLPQDASSANVLQSVRRADSHAKSQRGFAFGKLAAGGHVHRCFAVPDFPYLRGSYCHPIWPMEFAQGGSVILFGRWRRAQGVPTLYLFCYCLFSGFARVL